MRQAAETAPRSWTGEGVRGAVTRPWAAVSTCVFLSGIFLLPLICWPGLERPFSTPKMWLLGCLACFAAVASKGLGRGGWQWLLWPAALAVSALAASAASVEALLLAALPLPLAFMISRGGVPGRRVIRALLLASAAESAIVVLQYCGADPFRLLGWAPEQFESSRMRVYGTFGNPNFAAAWLCGTLPLYACVLSGGRNRRAWAVLLAIQAGAIVATGSRVPLIAVPVALVVLAAGRIRATKWMLAAVVPAAAAVLWLSPARPLGETVEGRLHIARVTTAHLKEVPPWGFGPGGFRLKFPRWQADWLNQRGPRDPSKRFAGPLDHAHNEYLEFWVDHGPLGLAAFFCLCGYLIWSARLVWRIPLATARGSVGFTEPRPVGSGQGSIGPPVAMEACKPLAHARGSVHPTEPRPSGSGSVDFRVPAWSAAAGAMALLGAAMVDFPFHRPAEWALLWVLMAVPGGVSAGQIETVHSVTSDQRRS